MQSFDVIIIGGGFLGVSTAYQLSKAGVRTFLLEKGDIGSEPLAHVQVGRSL